MERASESERAYVSLLGMLRIMTVVRWRSRHSGAGTGSRAGVVNTGPGDLSRSVEIPGPTTCLPLRTMGGSAEADAAAVCRCSCFASSSTPAHAGEMSLCGGEDPTGTGRASGLRGRTGGEFGGEDRAWTGREGAFGIEAWAFDADESTALLWELKFKGGGGGERARRFAGCLKRRSPG